MDMLEKYLESLERHISFVRQAGKRLGVDPAQLAQHDQSKYSEAELMPYARRFYGQGLDDEQVAADFQRAWLHHLHNNPHHWQHWVLINDEDGVDVLEMPQRYALEMVADWMGASMAYTGSWDMTEWLERNYPRVMLHPSTREYVNSVLRSLGYPY